MTADEDREETLVSEARIAVDELGPVDYLVVEFPAGHSTFTGEMAESLAQLQSAGTIRILDLLVLQKAYDGSVEGFEIDDLDADGLLSVEKDLAEILAAEDVDSLAAAMEPGTVAGVVVWENLWALPFASAARRAGGQLVATGRIPVQALLASFDDEIETMEHDLAKER